MYFSCRPWIFGLIPNPFVEYIISGDKAYIDKGIWFFKSRSAAVDLQSGATADVFFKWGALFFLPFGFGEVVISNNNKEIVWKDIYFRQKKASLINNFKSFTKPSESNEEKRSREHETKEKKETETHKELENSDTQIIKEPSNPLDNWELVNQIAHIPAFTKQIYETLQKLTPNKAGAPYYWKIKEGQIVDDRQIMAKFNIVPSGIRYPHKEQKEIIDQYGVIKSYSRAKILKIPKIDYSNYELRSSDRDSSTRRQYDYSNSMLIVQLMRNKETGDFSPVNVYDLALAHSVKEFFYHMEVCTSKKILGGWHREDKTYKSMMSARIRYEPLDFKNPAPVFDKNYNLYEEFAIRIPAPPQLLLDIARPYRQFFNVQFNIKAGDNVKEGDSIITFGEGHKSLTLSSPISGKIVFLALGEDDIKNILQHLFDNEIGQLWSEKDNWPAALYENQDYNEARTTLFMIQPEKGKNYNLNTVVEEFYDKLIKHCFNMLNDDYNLNFLQDSKVEEYRSFLEREEKKIKNCKARRFLLPKNESAEEKSDYEDCQYKNTSKTIYKDKGKALRRKDEQSEYDRLEEAKKRWDLPTPYTKNLVKILYPELSEKGTYSQEQLDKDYVLLLKHGNS